MSPGLSLDLVEDEGKVLRQVAQGNVTEGVAGRRLDLLRGVTECAEDRGLEVLEGAEVGPAPNLPDGQEAEGEAVVLLGGREGGHKLLDHHHGLPGGVTHQAGHTLGDVCPASLKLENVMLSRPCKPQYLVNAASFAAKYRMSQESEEVRVAQTRQPGSHNSLEEVQHG